MLGHHFETKTPSTNRTSSCWGTTSRPRHRQQIVHVCAGAPLRNQDTGNKSYILVLSRPRHRQQIVHLSAGAPLRDQDTGNKSYVLVLGHHFETKTPATNRTSQCWDTTSRPRHRQQIVHLRAGVPLRDQDTGNKSYILVLGHHFEDTGNKTYILVLGHRFETNTPATNRTS